MKSLVLWMLLCVLCPGWALAVELPPSDKILPEDTQIYFNIHHFPNFYDQFQKSSIYGLYADPAMKAFVEKTRNAIKEKLNEEGFELGRLIVDDQILPTGRVLLAYLPDPEGKKNEEDYLFLVQWGQNAKKVETAIRKDIQRQVMEGAQLKQETIGGIPITTFIRPEETIEIPSMDEEARIDSIKPDFENESSGSDLFTTDPTQIQICFYKDSLILCEKLSTMQFVMAHLQGASGKVLSKNTHFHQHFQTLGSKRPVEFFINLNALVRDVSQSFESDEKSQKTLSTLGLDSLNGLFASWQPAVAGKNSSQFRILLASRPPHKGLIKAFSLEPGNPEFPPFLDAQCGRYSWINADLAKIMGEISSALSQISPMMSASLMSPIIPPDSPDGSGSLTAMDLVRMVKNPIIITERIPSDLTEEFMETDTLIAVGVRQPEALQSAIAKLHGLFIAPRWPDSRRDFLGNTLYVIPVPQYEVEIDETGDTVPKEMAVNFAWAVANSYLLVGPEPSVEQAVRRMSTSSAQSLAQQSWIQIAQQQVPNRASMVSLADTREFGKMLWNTFAKPDSDLMWLLDSDLQEFVNPKLLPDFKNVQKHFGLNASWMETRPNGFYFESRELPYQKRKVPQK